MRMPICDFEQITQSHHLTVAGAGEQSSVDLAFHTQAPQVTLFVTSYSGTISPGKELTVIV